MEIHDDRHVARQRVEQRVHRAERTVGRIHEDAPQQVDDRHRAQRGLHRRVSLSRCPGRKVHRTDQPFLAADRGFEFALAPHMVAHCDHVRACGEEFFGQRQGDAVARRRVLGIDHHGMHCAFGPQPFHDLAEHAPSRAAHNVTHQQNLHRMTCVLSCARHPPCAYFANSMQRVSRTTTTLI